MSALRPCPACARHVQEDAPTCPFCGASIPERVVMPSIPTTNEGPWPVPAYGGPRTRDARIPWILIAVGALVAAALVGALVALLR